MTKAGKFLSFLEKWFDSPIARSKKHFDIFINPNRRELKEVADCVSESSDWHVRALIYKDNLYVWCSGVAMLHSDIAYYLIDKLGLEKEEMENFVYLYLAVTKEGRIKDMDIRYQYPGEYFEKFAKETVSKCTYITRLKKGV